MNFFSPFTSTPAIGTGSSVVVSDADFSTADYIVDWGLSDVTTQFDIVSNTTFQNITGLSQAGVLSGKRYKFEIILFIDNTINNGVKLVFSTAMSASYLIATADSYAPSGAIITHNILTSLGTPFCAVTALVERIEIRGIINVNVGGTFRLQIAQNTSHADTLSVLVGSSMSLWQMVV